MHVIQKCLEEHIDNLIELNMEVQRIHAKNHPELFKSEICKLALRQFYSQLLQDGNQYLLIAIYQGKVVGYIWAELVERAESLFTHSFRRLKINHISVAEHYKNTGVGSSLIEYVVEIAKEKSIHEIVLDVWQFNGKAINFFEKQSFKAFNINMWKQV